MQGLIAWWVRNPVAANLLMVGILISGWLGLTNIQKEAFPSVQPDLVPEPEETVPAPNRT